MKKIFTWISVLVVVAAGLCCDQQAQAQAPAWQSAVAAGQTGDTFFTAVVPDANSGVYVTGYFEGTVTFGNTTLASVGGKDIFVAKYQLDSNEFTWAQRAGGPSDDYPAAITSSGNSVYVAGSFRSNAINFGNVALTNLGWVNGFLVKLTDVGATGAFVWAQSMGGSAVDVVSKVAVTGNKLYVAGNFSSPTLNVGATTLTSAGQSDVFVAKLTDAGATGRFNWAQRAGGTSSDYPKGLAISGDNLYVAGGFEGPSFAWGNTTLPHADNYNLFIAKITDAGASSVWGWAQGVSGRDLMELGALAANGANVYVAGNFSGTNTTLGATPLTSVGNADVYVAKLIDTGTANNIVWAQRAGGSANDVAQAMAVSGTGIYVSGYFASTTATFGATTLACAGQTDIFATRLTDAGTTSSFSWAQRAGGTDFDMSRGLALSGRSVVMVGEFKNQAATFGTITIPRASAATGYVATLRDQLLSTTPTVEQATPTVYPNPAHRTALVQVSAPSKVDLLDALGRVVRTAVVSAGTTHPLDLVGLSPGIYALRAQVGETQSVQRLVVE